MLHVTDVTRRALIAVRHGLAPGHRHPSITAATAVMTAWHATEAYTVPLAVAARVDGVGLTDVEQALHAADPAERILVKQLAMRRTLFAFDRATLPAVWASAASRTAATQAATLFKALVASGVTDDAQRWWDEVSAVVLAEVARRGTVNAAESSTLHPDLSRRLQVGSGKWATEVPLGPRVLLVLGAQGRLVRAANEGHWRISRPRWGVTDVLLPQERAEAARCDARAGYAALVRGWLAGFGPGTEDDVVWWLGATRSAVRTAFADVGAVQVRLGSTDDSDGGTVGWVLPDDGLLDSGGGGSAAPEPGEWAALLPVLDPTVMGWKGRSHYLDDAAVAAHFDRNGNAGSTAWWNGRVVGCWVQDADATVRVVVDEHRHRELPATATAAFAVEAERLTEFLGGTVISGVYTTPVMKAARA
ncbi:winged helix DNA-binding domain-containing protein [Nocardioides yefusunii]|uniref:Winged helix DNA-binding domain-containing protein n=1 Tax=Nocardioides yefusunii TaxID=2500546 RepID=A0ABW1QY14_9ACTN|nr:winged helix DNA-binding domain-containing protein [Nocardioides yefusunii]